MNKVLIGFMSAPCTGKTTAALQLCLDYKLQGYACEYLSEAAREFHDRYGYMHQGIIELMEKRNIERAKKFTDRIWVSDSCIALSQFYGGHEYDTSDYDVVLTMDTIYQAKDSGRKHDYRQSVELQEKIMAFCANMPNCQSYKSFGLTSAPHKSNAQDRFLL